MFETLLFLVFLVLSLFLVIKSADFAIHYSTKVAQGLLLPRYLIGFLVVAFIAILPETFIAISSAFAGIPAFGLGTIFGSNVADLTLVFALVILLSGRNLKVESQVIKDRIWYVAVMAVPIVFGLNGHYSRMEGILLIVLGILFYVFIIKGSKTEQQATKELFSLKDILFLVISMAALLLGAHLTVRYGVSFAERLHVSPVIIGMFVVGLGTTLPEFLFSLRAAKHRYDSLAMGDILGIVVADATIVVGTIAVIQPFFFSHRIVYVTGIFMVLMIAALLHFMRTGRTLTRKEAFLLLLFYMLFVAAELFIWR